MTDFVNVYESDFVSGGFLDARGSNLLLTYPVTDSTSKVSVSNDNGETFFSKDMPLYRNTLCRISLDGQKLYTYSSVTRKFHKSHDGGDTWVNNKTRDQGTWFQISDDGQHHIFTRAGASLLYSNDYGDNFTEITKSVQKCDCDATGQYMCCVAKVNSDLIINISNDYGATWTEQTINAGGSSTTDCPISMSKTGQYILVGASGINFRVSSDYGVSFQEVPNTNQQWKHCEISYLNPQYMYAQLESQTNTIWESQDYGQSWSAVYNHPQNISYANMSSTNSYLFAFNKNRNRVDRYTFTHSAPSGGGETSGGEETSSTPTSSSTIYFDTAPIVKRFSTTITDASSVSFSMPLPDDLKHYKITLLNDTAINGNPAFVGDVWYSTTEQVVVPVVSQKITAQSFNDNVLTFTFDGNYSGTFTLSVMRSS